MESVSRFPGTWILECPAAHKLEIHVPGDRWWDQSDDSEGHGFLECSAADKLEIHVPVNRWWNQSRDPQGHGFWSARRLTGSKSMSLGIAQVPPQVPSQVPSQVPCPHGVREVGEGGGARPAAYARRRRPGGVGAAAYARGPELDH